MTQSESIAINEKPAGLIQKISIRFGGSKPKELERFLKFVMVGIIGTVIDLGIANLLIAIFHIGKEDVVQLQIAGGISFVIAVIGNFILNRYWTYPDSRSRSVVRQLLQFFAVNAVGLLIREIVVGVMDAPFMSVVTSITKTSISANLQSTIASNMALVMSIGIVMFWNFFINRYWTYSDVE